MKKKTVSASDINKFTHCPYQWYYEKKYGVKAIREMRREPYTQTKDPRQSAFNRGIKFHNRHYEAYRRKKRLATVCYALIALILLGVVIWTHLS